MKKSNCSLDAGEGRQEQAEFDRVLVAVGRKPLVRGLGMEELAIRRDEEGFILVDEDYRTNVPGVYAIGDLSPAPCSHTRRRLKGSPRWREWPGVQAKSTTMPFPAVVYTSPEAASVGKTEQELKTLGVEYKSAVFPFSGTGRAQCLGETAGFVKILARTRSGRILGVHIIGPRASELIAECVIAVRSHMSAETKPNSPCPPHALRGGARKRGCLAQGVIAFNSICNLQFFYLQSFFCFSLFHSFPVH